MHSIATKGVKGSNKMSWSERKKTSLWSVGSQRGLYKNNHTAFLIIEPLWIDAKPYVKTLNPSFISLNRNIFLPTSMSLPQPSLVCFLPRLELTFVALCLSLRSHDFIGEFTTSYKDLSRGQSQLNVFEVNADKDAGQYRYRRGPDWNLWWMFLPDPLFFEAYHRYNVKLLIWTRFDERRIVLAKWSTWIPRLTKKRLIDWRDILRGIEGRLQSEHVIGPKWAEI